jgi:hypothetical protein
VRRALGASADATTTTADVRMYLPSLAEHHVVAIRVAGGFSNGSPTEQRTFLLGGSAPSADVLDFSGQAFSLLRGFPFATFAGTRVAVVNAEYRWPIARPQRGAGTWPLFLHTIHASAFGDAGNAWTNTFGAHDLKTSVGAELSANLVAGYSFPFIATAGVAWGHERSGTVPRDLTAYFRIGRAF